MVGPYWQVARKSRRSRFEASDRASRARGIRAGAPPLKMRLNRRDFSAALLSTALFGRTLADATVPAVMTSDPKDGVQYESKRPAIRAEAGARIEVLEFFSYACPHCRAFESQLDIWAHGLPVDVAFRRVPVPFIANAPALQRLYFAIEEEGAVDAMHSKVFDAIQVEHRRLDSQSDVASLAAASGLDPARFLQTYNGTRVSGMMAQATASVGTYQLGSVPTLAIQGRFLTSPAQAGSEANALSTADFLIAAVRLA